MKRRTQSVEHQSEVGSYTVTVTTMDESGNATETTFTIDVEDTTKPTVESVADQTQEVNTEITPITIESEDNSDQAVTNKVDGLPDGVTFDEATNTISGTPSEVGSYTVTVTTTDEEWQRNRNDVHNRCRRYDKTNG